MTTPPRMSVAWPSPLQALRCKLEYPSKVSADDGGTSSSCVICAIIIQIVPTHSSISSKYEHDHALPTSCLQTLPLAPVSEYDFLANQLKENLATHKDCERLYVLWCRATSYMKTIFLLAVIGLRARRTSF